MGDVMLNELFSNLATLASLEYQERYVIGGTEQEHVAIDDLIDDFLASVDWMNTQIMSESDRNALNDFAQFLDKNRDGALAAKSFAEVKPLMRNSQIWMDIRLRASEAMSLLDLDWHHIPVEELDEHIWDYGVQQRIALRD
ncbi:MAG: hypothetical protein AAGE37_07615 [Pseudomonadota bacterium]